MYQEKIDNRSEFKSLAALIIFCFGGASLLYFFIKPNPVFLFGSLVIIIICIISAYNSTRERMVTIDEDSIKIYKSGQLEKMAYLAEVKELSTYYYRIKHHTRTGFYLHNGRKEILTVRNDFDDEVQKRMFVEIAKYADKYGFVIKDEHDIFNLPGPYYQRGREDPVPIKEEPQPEQKTVSVSEVQPINIKCPKCSKPIIINSGRTFPIVKCPSCARAEEQKQVNWLLHINPENKVFDQCPRCKKYCLINASIKNGYIEFACTKCRATFQLDKKDAINVAP